MLYLLRQLKKCILQQDDATAMATIEGIRIARKEIIFKRAKVVKPKKEKKPRAPRTKVTRATKASAPRKHKDATKEFERLLAGMGNEQREKFMAGITAGKVS